ncbi:MAG: DUF4143 domain-containing protein [Muribaculaceae bacterium]|nr:DUF4143 domain-containing protein [Muribaculaceae bacterium]
MEYRPRIADKLLADKLEAKGAVLIRGPKWCGKTTTAEQYANSILYVSNPAQRENILQLADMDPQQLLFGKTPRLLDEWQTIPVIWDAVRYEVDHRQATGQFILTGSAVPYSKDSKVLHTGTGRFAIIDMLPMSLSESGDSTAAVSLRALFEDPDSPVRGYSEVTLQDVAYLTCRGGWPFAVSADLSEKASLSQAMDYVDLVVEEDISRVDKTERNAERARKLMRSYARYQGTQTPVSQIRKDIIANEQDSITDDTINSYLNALRQIFVIKDLEAWNPNLQSKSAIRTSPTRYFIDPSIATASLRIGPKDLMQDLKTFGFIFETLCIRDLRVYAQALDGDLYHYRDSNGLECDAVLHLRNGKYGLIEIKLGGEKLIDEGARNLKKLQSIIDTSKMSEPSFLMVLTATGNYAYRRSDGVCVVPISTLGC